MKQLTSVLLLALALLPACHSGAGMDTGALDAGSESSSDSDTTTGADADTDGDTDSATGEDTDVDTEEVVQGYGGSLVCAVRAGGIERDSGFGVAVLPDGSSFVVGDFAGEATFGEGEPNETVLSTTGDYDKDIFVARYNPDCTLAWVGRAGGSGADEPYFSEDWATDVVALSDDSFYVTGMIDGPATFGMSETQSIDVVAGLSDIYVARFTSTGEVSWVESAGGTKSDTAMATAALSDGSVAVTGKSGGAIVFDDGGANETELDWDESLAPLVFLARYTTDGALAWAKMVSTVGAGNGLATGPDDSIFVVGYFEGISTFGLGDEDEITVDSIGDGADVYVAKYDESGDFAWVVTCGGDLDDNASGVAVLADGAIAVTGAFEGVAVFGEGEESETTLVSIGSQDVFVALFDDEGVLLWARSAGSTADYDAGFDITADPDGSVIAVGALWGNAVFGLGEPNETLLLVGGDYANMFAAKYEPDGDLAWARAELCTGGAHPMFCNGVAALESGDFFVAGEFSGQATFGQLEANETALSSAGGTGCDIFFARYSQ
jgi:hypothetical protein